jgi:hypothetical protein
MPGSEKRLEAYAELTGRVLEFYTKQYGAPLFGNVRGGPDRRRES